nr:hypothetical protein CFP56_52390 [Quercus suber]
MMAEWLLSAKTHGERKGAYTYRKPSHRCVRLPRSCNSVEKSTASNGTGGEVTVPWAFWTGALLATSLSRQELSRAMVAVAESESNEDSCRACLHTSRLTSSTGPRPGIMAMPVALSRDHESFPVLHLCWSANVPMRCVSYRIPISVLGSFCVEARQAHLDLLLPYEPLTVMRRHGLAQLDLVCLSICPAWSPGKQAVSAPQAQYVADYCAIVEPASLDIDECWFQNTATSSRLITDRGNRRKGMRTSGLHRAIELPSPHRRIRHSRNIKRVSRFVRVIGASGFA